MFLYVELEEVFKAQKNQVFYGVLYFLGKFRNFKLHITLFTAMVPALRYETFTTIFVTSDLPEILTGIQEKLSVKGLIEIMVTVTFWKYFKWKNGRVCWGGVTICLFCSLASTSGQSQNP